MAKRWLLFLVLATISDFSWASVDVSFELIASKKLSVEFVSNHGFIDYTKLWIWRVQAAFAEQERLVLVRAGKLPDRKIYMVIPQYGNYSPDNVIQTEGNAIRFYWSELLDFRGAMRQLALALEQKTPGIDLEAIGGRKRPMPAAVEFQVGRFGIVSEVWARFGIKGLQRLSYKADGVEVELPLPKGQFIAEAQYSGDGRYFALGTDKELLLFDCQEHSLTSMPIGPGRPHIWGWLSRETALFGCGT